MGETRSERICVHETEKNRLEDIREGVYGTSSVPLGEVLTHLMNQYGGA